eukprot:4315996-Amphidinium_carterae.3
MELTSIEPKATWTKGLLKVSIRALDVRRVTLDDTIIHILIIPTLKLKTLKSNLQPRAKAQGGKHIPMRDTSECGTTCA